MSRNIDLGKCGENFAAEVLESQGYSILERNFRCRLGEIDLIAEKNGELCFVEVKTRNSDAFGRPSEAVTRDKQKRIKRTAAFYMQSCRMNQRYISFQVIEILLNQIEHAF